MSTFTDQQGNQICNASQKNNNARQVTVNGSKFSYPAHSLFAKFSRQSLSSLEELSLHGFVTSDLEDSNGNDDAARMSMATLQQSHDRRIAENAKYNPWDTHTHTIMSPMEEVSLYSFVTSNNDLDESNSNEGVAAMSLTKLQELHDHRVAEDAKYEPWDTKSFAHIIKDLSINAVTADQEDSSHAEDVTPEWSLQQLGAYRLDEDVKYNPWDCDAFRERAVVSPTQDLSLQSSVTIDLGNSNNNHDGTPMSLTDLQQSHNRRVSENAKYTPWDANGTIVTPVKEPSLHAVNVENNNNSEGGTPFTREEERERTLKLIRLLYILAHTKLPPKKRKWFNIMR